MSKVKVDAIKFIEKLPDDCSITDIFERVLFLEKIREGKEDAEKGNLIEGEEVEKKFSKWLK